MKIGLDISQVTYRGTGVARYMHNLTAHLISDDTSNEFILYGNSLRDYQRLEEYYKAVQSLNNNIQKKFYHFPQSLMNLLWNRLHKVSIESFTGNVDVFHTSDWVEPPAKAKKITTIHDLIFIKYPHLFPKIIVDTQKYRLHWVEKESSAVIVDSQSTKMDCLQYLDIKEDKVFVVYPGIDKIFRPVGETIADKILLKHKINKPYILTVGTQEPRKNIDKVIRSFNVIREKANIQLVIVGNSGWGRGQISEGDIINLGYITDSELAAIYSQTVCLVYPSTYEGFGFPVLEALACGANVVTSENSSLKEIGNKFPIYVNPNNISEITQAVRLSLDKKNQSAQAIKWAASFTWERTVKQIMKIYQKFA